MCVRDSALESLADEGVLLGIGFTALHDRGLSELAVTCSYPTPQADANARLGARGACDQPFTGTDGVRGRLRGGAPYRGSGSPPPSLLAAVTFLRSPRWSKESLPQWSVTPLYERWGNQLAYAWYQDSAPGRRPARPLGGCSPARCAAWEATVSLTTPQVCVMVCRAARAGGASTGSSRKSWLDASPPNNRCCDAVSCSCPGSPSRARGR